MFLDDLEDGESGEPLRDFSRKGGFKSTAGLKSIFPKSW